MSLQIILIVAGVVALAALLLLRRDKPRRVGYSENEAAREHWRKEHRDRRHDAPSPAASRTQVQGLDMLPADIRDDVARLLREGRKIEAIKAVREATGRGLKEAKDFIDGIEKAMRRGPD